MKTKLIMMTFAAALLTLAAAPAQAGEVRLVNKDPQKSYAIFVTFMTAEGEQPDRTCAKPNETYTVDRKMGSVSKIEVFITKQCIVGRVVSVEKPALKDYSVPGLSIGRKFTVTAGPDGAIQITEP